MMSVQIVHCEGTTRADQEAVWRLLGDSATCLSLAASRSLTTPRAALVERVRSAVTSPSAAPTSTPTPTGSPASARATRQSPDGSRACRASTASRSRRSSSSETRSPACVGAAVRPQPGARTRPRADAGAALRGRRGAAPRPALRARLLRTADLRGARIDVDDLVETRGHHTVWVARKRGATSSSALSRPRWSWPRCAPVARAGRSS